MKRANKIVYAPMSADIIHPGHIHLIQEAQKYGNVVVGLLSDAAIEQKKGHKPTMTFEERFVIVDALRGVSEVIEQDTPDYRPNLLELRPGYVIHGDDWTAEAKQSIESTISKWGGELIETDYSACPTSSTEIKHRIVNTWYQSSL